MSDRPVVVPFPAAAVAERVKSVGRAALAIDPKMEAIGNCIIDQDAHFELIAVAVESGKPIPEQCVKALEFHALKCAGLARSLLEKNADTAGLAPPLTAASAAEGEQ